MPKYIPNKPHTFNHRLEMCAAVGEMEGTEIGDAISSLVNAARVLRGLEDDFHAESALLLAENLSRQHVKDWVWSRCCDWEEYEACDPDVFAHFTGGAKKLTEEEFHKR